MKNKNPVLYNLFSSFGVFSSAEIEHILSQFESKIYKKGAVILDIGEINDKLYFIESGILREFSVKDQDQDQTITHWLMAENDFQYVADSFLEEKPSTVAIDVLEKAKLWVISKEKIDKLYLECPQLNFIGRVLLEQNTIKYEAFITALRQKKEERLEWFYKYHKGLINRVPLRYIATYLNMTPQALSRVRTKMAKAERKK
ncbi:MAG: Crp/Fnr family transcriptional regulator [Emticicia sp.]|uniref:Crp/Fnr family transcriptional regulator n=1 Tax=Emticicia sp. TaxID=1930953 RepID=UPI003BA560C0